MEQNNPRFSTEDLESFIEALQQLLLGNITNVSKGICYNARKIMDHPEHISYEMVEKYSEDWPPREDNHPSVPIDDQNPLNKWEGKSLKLRKSLINHCIRKALEEIKFNFVEMMNPHILRALHELKNLVLKQKEIPSSNLGICRNLRVLILKYGVPEKDSYYSYEFVKKGSEDWKHNQYPGVANGLPVPYTPGLGRWEGIHRELRLDLIDHLIGKLCDGTNEE